MLKVGEKLNASFAAILAVNCADAALVCVAPLKKVIELNEGYEYIKNSEWTRTIIHNFTGHVYLDFKKDEDGFEYVEVVGEGNINFRTKQTGA